MLDIDVALEKAAEVGRHFEGFQSFPYQNPGDVPTIGYGATIYPDGRRVTLRDHPIDEPRARELQIDHLRHRCLPVLLKNCPQIDTSNRMAALLDWLYNFSETKLMASTLLKRIKASDWNAVKFEIRRWDKAKDEHGNLIALRGLTLRRQAEADLI